MSSFSQSNSGESCTDDQLNEFFQIGKGTFGTVYVNFLTPGAYKKCRSPDNCAALAEEYRQLKLISEALQASGNAIFHDDVEFWDESGLVFPPSDSIKTCTYYMSRVYPLPLSAFKAKLVDLFCPPDLKAGALGRVQRGQHPGRLLLGSPESDAKQDAAQTFFDTYNFPLTRERAEELGIDTVSLSREMGRMLTQLHMTARNDARGVKVLLGANITNSTPNPQEQYEPRAWVLDFNQVKVFNLTENQIPLLVNGFFANEAYFPRARPADPLYSDFSKAYLEECDKIGEVAGQLGQKFILALEEEQARRDTNLVSI